ncbi:bifunctional pyr operon transcriptional regulator/uracil phosphoribosyltransferase PyrR [Auraticoccus cholistanensis]|uniref:bifunctional pyr operon transcriptional regulator/uracil phosphoribosyltransferase PyrR n=1 Tax=Auraticoccus cholistanensis TaxID=2656650 RepID=UPI002F913BE5
MPRTPDPATGRVVIDAAEMSRTLTRMAHQVLEANHGARDLVVLGIPTRGVPLARRLAGLMADVEGHPVPVGQLDVTMYRDDLRTQPTRPVGRTVLPAEIDGAVVVLVDDVLYSGRTVVAALDALSDLGRPAAVRLAVLVDRGHRQVPVRADHVGKNLPTASHERVQVRLEEIDGVDDVTISRVLEGSRAEDSQAEGSR